MKLATKAVGGIKPTKPWSKNSPQNILFKLIPSVSPIFLAAALVAVTDLKGKIGFLLAWAIFTTVFILIWPFVIKSKNARGELFLQAIISISSLTFFAVIAWVFSSVLTPGIKAFTPSLFLGDSSNVEVDTPLNQGGLLHALLGSIIVVGIATLISVPFGILSALYITEVRGKLVPYVRFFIQAMSGVPSIVARVAGETAPLLLTAFGGNTVNLNPFEGSMATLPWYIFSQMALGTENDVARAWFAALTLLILVSITFSLARVLNRKRF